MTERTCTFDGCERDHSALGLCKSHWQQQYLGKELSPIQRLDSSWSSLREKIEHSLDKQPDGCWIWTRARHPFGHGLVRWNGTLVYVHRAYLKELGTDVPDDLVVDHLCGVPACANPDHLEVVTQKENVYRGTSPAASYAGATHCIHGHEFDSENTYIAPTTGQRICKTCGKARRARYREEGRA